MISTLLDLARTLRGWPARASYRAALARRELHLPGGEPVLAFGDARPGAGGLVHGGRVKLMHLAERFRHDEEHFNTLYLVSSAIPQRALELAIWARARGAKLVWNQNGVGFPAWAGASFERFNRPMEELIGTADFVVYQSAFCRESADRFLGAPRGESVVLFNPVDVTAFSPATEPPDLGCWQLLAAGTHNQSARVIGAIETLAELRRRGHDAHLTIAGRLNWPNAPSEVKSALARHGIAKAVTLRAGFSQTEAAELLRASHVLLHTKYHDPCPTMVIEALACGVPVIGSRSGGMPELVGGEGGELIDVPLSWERAAYPTAPQIAGAVERVMEEWAARSRAARLRAQKLFDAEQWVAAHRRIFETITS